MSFFDFNKVIIKPAGKSLKTISVLNPLTIHKKGTRTKAIFALALVCFFWGTTWIASKEGVRHMPPLQMAGIRQSLGGLCYVLFFLFKGARWPNKKEWQSIIVLSFLNFLISERIKHLGSKIYFGGIRSHNGSHIPFVAGGDRFVFCQGKDARQSNPWFAAGIWWSLHYLLRTLAGFFQS